MSELVAMWRLERNGLGPFQAHHSGRIHKGDQMIRWHLDRRFSQSKSWHRGSTVAFRADDDPERFVYGCETEYALTYFFGPKILKMCTKRGYEVKLYWFSRDQVRYGFQEMAALAW